VASTASSCKNIFSLLNICLSNTKSTFKYSINVEKVKKRGNQESKSDNKRVTESSTWQGEAARGPALEVRQVGVRRGQFTALVTHSLRALPLADFGTWYVHEPLNPNI
jgi:hypothetical protein